MDPLLQSDDSKTANVHVLASVTNLISVQINKFQAMFLTKILKQFSEVCITHDLITNFINVDEGFEKNNCTAIKKLTTFLITYHQKTVTFRI